MVAKLASQRGFAWLALAFLSAFTLSRRSYLRTAVEGREMTVTRDSTDAALDRGRAASVLMPAKPVAAV